MIFEIKGGKRNGERFEADFKEGTKLFKRGYVTVHDVAADGSVMTSKVVKIEPVFEAQRDEEIVELK